MLKDCRIIDNEGPAVLFFGGTWKGSNTDNVINGGFIKGNNRSRDFYCASAKKSKRVPPSLPVKRGFRWSPLLDFLSEGLYNNTFAMMHPDNTGIVKNTTIHLLTEDQGFDSRPLTFEESSFFSFWKSGFSRRESRFAGKMTAVLSRPLRSDVGKRDAPRSCPSLAEELWQNALLLTFR